MALNFTKYYNNINLLVKKLSEIYLQLPPEITDNIRNIILNLSNSLTDIINSIVGGIFATAVSIPEILIFVFATILAAYFFSSDKEKITGFIKTHLPESWIVKYSRKSNRSISPAHFDCNVSGF